MKNKFFESRALCFNLTQNQIHHQHSCFHLKPEVQAYLVKKGLLH